MRQAFVVTPARCGSTLLRYLLDSHPEIVSPPELNLSALLQHLVDAWGHTEVAMGAPLPSEQPAGAPISKTVLRQARRAVDEIMVNCANAAGASVYCDKSLTTIDHLGTVSQCYPKAPMVFLYRYPLDVIASGLEASRWGFNAFGFVPYVTAAPGNFISGLAQYWIDRVSKMLEFERTFTGPSARIYYELLCDDPLQTLESLFEFLEVSPDPTVIERAFASNHGRGPGDYKIDYTGSISAGSIGRGSSLPEHIPAHQVNRMNELLAELDYPDLEAAWRGDLAALLGLGSSSSNGATAGDIAQSIVTMFSTPGSELLETHRGALPFELVITQVGAGEPARVLIDSDATATTLDSDAMAATPNGAGPADTSDRPRIRCSGDVVLQVAAGEVRFGNAVRDGDIRVERETDETQDSDRQPRRPHELLAALAALIRAHA